MECFAPRFKPRPFNDSMSLCTKITADIQIYVDNPSLSVLCLLECFYEIWLKFGKQRADSSFLAFDVLSFWAVDNKTLLVPKYIIPGQSI
ncbi:MAG: hypothetical protein JXB29_06440 [Sedimentisphaerales bacterium]|nr:hypothetical protein [Sedimentisphaerales bacterium]